MLKENDAVCLKCFSRLHFTDQVAGITVDSPELTDHTVSGICFFSFNYGAD